MKKNMRREIVHGERYEEFLKVNPCGESFQSMQINIFMRGVSRVCFCSMKTAVTFDGAGQPVTLQNKHVFAHEEQENKWFTRILWMRYYTEKTIGTKIPLSLQVYMLIQHNQSFTDNCPHVNNVHRTRKKKIIFFLTATVRIICLYVP